MQGNHSILIDYPAELKKINGIRLTNRELDIIACLNYRRASDSSIAELLTINKRTVETHIRNITQKLNCPPKKIRTFIEDAGYSSQLLDHYHNIVYFRHFKLLMNTISSIIQSSKNLSLPAVLYTETKLQNELDSILPWLGLSGISATLADIEAIKYGSSSIENNSSVIISSAQQLVNITSAIRFFDYSTYKNRIDLILDTILHITLNPEIKALVASFLTDKNCILESTKPFDVGAKTFLTLQPPPKQPSSFYLPSKNVLLLILLSILFFIIIGTMIAYFISSFSEQGQKRSELLLPPPAALLKREDLIHKIQSFLYPTSTDYEIPTVTISGIGGAGKTTLARIVAHHHKGVVWELNAENEKSLKASIKELAYTFADSAADREQLKFIVTLNTPKDQEKQIYIFVQNKLRQHPNWLLIFDNVRSADILKEYCPKDAFAWGKGSVLITTRDANISHGQHHAIQLKELSRKECVKLFSQVLFPHHTPTKLENEKISTFTQSIPAFPLDIVMAATFLSQSQINYDQYTAELYNKQLQSEQQDILATQGNYNKTRQDIIAVSLEKILNNQENIDLLILISLINSQMIPKSLLQKYSKREKAEAFIKELKKYSLITSETFVKNIPVFSMHASIQSSIHNYLTTMLTSSEYENALYRTIPVFESYINESVNDLNHDEIQLLLTHTDIARKHTNLPKGIVSILNLSYANLLTTLPGIPSNLVQLLETVIDGIQHNLPTELHDPLRLARCLSIIGDRYRSACDFDKASDALEKSLKTYEKLSPRSIEAAKTYVRAGTLSRLKGKYTDARALLLKGIDIYNEYPSKHHSKDTFLCLGLNERDCGHYKKALEYLQLTLDSIKDKNDSWYFWINGHIGTIYLDAGCYAEALNCFENSYNLLRYSAISKDISLSYAWRLANIGTSYALLSNPEKALPILEESLKIFERLAEKKIFQVLCSKLVFPNMAYCHMLQGNFDKAKQLLHQSLHQLENQFGTDHTQTTRVLIYLGRIALLEGSLDKAEQFMMQAQHILDSNKHTDIYLSLEGLSDVYYAHYQRYHTKEQELAFKNKDQALTYLLKAIEAVKTHLPASSVHLDRLNKKRALLQKKENK